MASMVLAAFLAGCLIPTASAPDTDSFRADQWWNRATTQPAKEESRLSLRSGQKYVVLCFRKENRESLRKVVPGLNRLHVRREWDVVGLSPDDPNAVVGLVYGCRMRFPVGAGTREPVRLGVKKFPSLVLLGGEKQKPEVCEDIEARVAALLGLGVTGASASAPAWPQTAEEVTAELPLEVLRGCALEAPDDKVRVAALKVLQARLPAEEFEVLVAEAMAAEPPERWRANPATCAMWRAYGLRHFIGAPDIWSYPGYTVRGRQRGVYEMYKELIATISIRELAEDYLNHLSDSEADLALRNAILDRFCESWKSDEGSGIDREKIDAREVQEVLLFLPRLMSVERDPALRWQLVGYAMDAARLGLIYPSPEMVTALLQCLDPKEHIAVRSYAEAALEMIYASSGQP